jgi:hypothetical protein
VAVLVIKKTSPEYALQKDPPPCPSVELNGRIIAWNDIITYEALKASILSDSDIAGGRS